MLLYNFIIKSKQFFNQDISILMTLKSKRYSKKMFGRKYVYVEIKTKTSNDLLSKKTCCFPTPQLFSTEASNKCHAAFYPENYQLPSKTFFEGTDVGFYDVDVKSNWKIKLPNNI